MCTTSGETTSLLGHHQDPLKKESDIIMYNEMESRNILMRRIADMSIGFALCAILATLLSSGWYHHPQHPPQVAPVVPNHQHQYVERHTNPDAPIIKDQPPQHGSLRSSGVDGDKNRVVSSDESSTTIGPSKYSQFQALGFQIYTGGAPALIQQQQGTSGDDADDSSSVPTMIHNPECDGLNSYGHYDDYDVTNTTLPSSLWQCYLGHADTMQDIRHRLQIMNAAVERAHQEAANDDPSILKIFVAPEFFWRGREGAYVFEVQPNTTTQPPLTDHEKCAEVCQIMTGLEQLVANKKYEDWLFLFGTVVVSETLPKEDAYDYLFYNFAPVYKGYDPQTQDHHGKRFLVPKRYVSNVDFLTPVRQYNGTMTKELVELTQQQVQLAREGLIEDDDSVVVNVKPTNDDEPIVVNNPFILMKDFYDRDMWYVYKDELKDLGYTMIEYDWLILDNITFTIEVCLDHDARTALDTYLADNALGSPSRIPKSVATWDPVTQKFVGGVEEVGIPRHQAQLSLVSSMGMTANPQSLALTYNGSLILQDGQSADNGTMAFELDCDIKSWHFKGGTEFISRTAAITSTKIDFKYQIHAPKYQFGVYEDLKDSEEHGWKEAVRGVFTTTKYEPKITMYPVRDIAKV